MTRAAGVSIANALNVRPHFIPAPNVPLTSSFIFGDDMQYQSILAMDFLRRWFRL